MNQLVKITLDPDIKNDPKTISDLITKIAEEIEECKDDLMEIKNRSFWKKMFSSNTRDLADAILKQNDTISVFLNIVQALIMFNMHNLVLLSEIQNELCKHEESKGDFQNKYINMAKEFITESYNSAVTYKNKIEKQERNFELIKTDLINKNKLDEKQNKLILRGSLMFGQC